MVAVFGFALVGSAATVPQPVIVRDFPDPGALLTPAGDYAYSTNSRYSGVELNVPEARAATIAGPWTATGVDALPVLPPWVSLDPGTRTDDVWAPDVSRLDDGDYVMYYAAHDANGLLCVGAAIAADPVGPFQPVAQPLVCNESDYGDIDPTAFAWGGRHYLIYKDNANSAGRPDSIWITEIAADGVTVLGQRVRMVTADADQNENTVAEAPSLIWHDGEFVLLYSADAWNSTYHMKYAVSRRLLAAYTKQGTFTDTATWGGAIVSPGGEYATVGPDGADVLFFHGNTSGGRGMFVDRLDWPHGVPHLAGAPPLPDGEYTFTALVNAQPLAIGDSGTAWRLRCRPDGACRITSAATGLALSAAGRLSTAQPFSGGPNQWWYVDRDFNGYFRISAQSTGDLLAIDGTQLALTPNTDDPTQKWLPTSG